MEKHIEKVMVLSRNGELIYKFRGSTFSYNFTKLQFDLFES